MNILGKPPKMDIFSAAALGVWLKARALRTAKRKIESTVHFATVIMIAHATASATYTLAVDELTGKASNECYKRLKELG